MSLSKKKIIHHFNNAEKYNDSSYVQKSVAQNLIARIKEFYKNNNQPISILEIGCGSGHLTKLLFKLFPHATFVITDISEDMLKRAQRAVQDHNVQASFLQMDGEAIALETSFDLICSNFTFQWFLDLPTAMDNISQCLTPNGSLFFTTLAEKTFVEWRNLYNQHQYPCSLQSYPSQEILNTCWPDFGSGFLDFCEIIDGQTSGLTFLKGLHNIGAQTTYSNHIPLTYGQLHQIIDDYDEQYGYTTYEVAYGFFRRFAGNGFFVTGTDTDVGKTFISACLTKALKAIYWKVMQTGLNTDKGDTYTVKQLISLSDEQIIKPWVELQEPLSPEEAAKCEGYSLNLYDYEIPQFYLHKNYIIEGAGGALVPIASDQYMIDLMTRINLPVIIVARTSLGTLNHTLMTIELLRKSHIAIAGVILNGEFNQANKEAIEKHGKVKIIAEIPKFDSISKEIIEIGASLISL